MYGAAIVTVMAADRSLIEARNTLVRRRDELNQAIHALDRVIGDKPAVMAPAKPNRNGTRSSLGGRGARTDAVVEILKAQPGEGISPGDLADLLEARGVPLRSENPARAARAAGNRARERDPSIKLEGGKFVYAPSETSQDPSPPSSGDHWKEGDSRGDLGSPGSLP